MLLRLSFRIFGWVRIRRVSWIIGTDEIAGVLAGISVALPDSHTVNLSIPSLRDETFDFSLPRGPFHEIRRLIFGPLLLGYLMNSSDQFFYIWSRGFLFKRSNEFQFLKAKNKRIALMFCGDDIRSPRLHRELCERMNRETFANYGFYLSPPGGTDEYEFQQQEMATIAEKYADVIFNAPICQTSYLDSLSPKIVAAHGFISLQSYQFCLDDNKFNEPVIKIVHAPTSTSTKGTRFVREAIARLEKERSDFVYIELQFAPHSEVIQTLKDSHICLNQFLSFGTGVLGIEAMAARCATLMSADPLLEPSIPMPQDGTNPWMITQSHQIYENLTFLLENKDVLAKTANEGFEYAIEHYSSESSTARLHMDLEQRGFSVAKED